MAQPKRPVKRVHKKREKVLLPKDKQLDAEQKLAKRKEGIVNLLVQELMFFHNITSVIQKVLAWKI